MHANHHSRGNGIPGVSVASHRWWAAHNLRKCDLSIYTHCRPHVHVIRPHFVLHVNGASADEALVMQVRRCVALQLCCACANRQTCKWEHMRCVPATRRTAPAPMPPQCLYLLALEDRELVVKARA